jgi:hypothetical protein
LAATAGHLFFQRSMCSDGLPIPTRSATGSLDSSRERVAMVKPEPDGAISDGDIELNASDVSDEDKEGMDYLPEESAENASRPAHRRVRKVGPSCAGRLAYVFQICTASGENGEKGRGGAPHSHAPGRGW